MLISKAMQFEQTAELNRYVLSTIPLTWSTRWRVIKPVLPILLCCAALLLEQLALRLWLSDRSLLSQWPLLLLVFVLPVILMVFGLELQCRVDHRSKRTLRLDPNGIFISPAKYRRLRWKQVRAWRITPVPATPNLCKLSLEYSLAAKGRATRHWSMALRVPEQEHELRSELEHYRQRGIENAVFSNVSEQTVPAKPRIRSNLAAALGMFLLLNGVPLLGVSLLPQQKHSTDPSSSQFTAEQQAKFQRVIRRSFSSYKQFRVFVLSLGGTLSLFGAALYFWGLSSPSNAKRLRVPVLTAPTPH